MESLENYVSIEKDAFYLISKDRAEERFVRSLLTKLDWTTEQIADIAEVSPYFVERIRQKVAAGE